MAKAYHSPFLYPQARHIRKYSSRNRTYTKFRGLLRREFGRKCVYCCAPDISNVRKKEFEIDHYNPENNDSSLKSVYTNLFYSCSTCNGFKSSFWPTPAQWKAGIYVPNPCQDVMTDHLKFKDGEVVSKSSAGKWAEGLLHLNDLDSKRFRKDLQTLVESGNHHLKLIEGRLKKIEKELKKPGVDVRKLASDKVKLEATQKEIELLLYRRTRR